jgi:hypothetical protein
LGDLGKTMWGRGEEVFKRRGMQGGPKSDDDDNISLFLVVGNKNSGSYVGIQLVGGLADILTILPKLNRDSFMRQIRALDLKK